MTDFSDSAMRARFQDLTAQREAILSVSTPLREARDAEVNALLEEARSKRAAADEAIRAAEQGLFEIDQERANIVRALKGQTGEPA